MEASDSDTSDEESARDENGVRIRKPKEGQQGVSEVCTSVCKLEMHARVMLIDKFVVVAVML